MPILTKKEKNLNKKLYSKLPPQITPIQNFEIPTSEGENYNPEDSFQKKKSASCLVKPQIDRPKTQNIFI